MEGPLYWILFNAFVLVALALDLGVFHKRDAVPTVKSSLLWTLFWIVLSLVFCGGVYVWMDHGKALDFLTCYLLEKSLSIDNLFVFILLFNAFKIPAEYQHRVLFWGILCAIVLRAVFIFAGAAIVSSFSWTMYIFGAFLIYSGVKSGIPEKKSANPDEESGAIRVVKKFLHISEVIDGHNFFTKLNGKVVATPLLAALVVIEMSDIMFAVDSVPAALSVTTDAFIVYTSNIFAILGLRQLYFAISGIMWRFRYIKYALAGILTFIGVKMCFNELSKELAWGVEISNVASLTVIVVLVTAAIIASSLKK